jgi:hypothetical protein
VKRLVTLLAGLTLFMPVMHWETSLLQDLNAALSTSDAQPARPHVDVKLPSAVHSLVDTLDR